MLLGPKPAETGGMLSTDLPENPAEVRFAGNSGTADLFNGSLSLALVKYGKIIYSRKFIDLSTGRTTSIVSTTQRQQHATTIIDSQIDMSVCMSLAVLSPCPTIPPFSGRKAFAKTFACGRTRRSRPATGSFHRKEKTRQVWPHLDEEERKKVKGSAGSAVHIFPPGFAKNRYFW